MSEEEGTVGGDDALAQREVATLRPSPLSNLPTEIRTATAPAVSCGIENIIEIKDAAEQTNEIPGTENLPIRKKNNRGKKKSTSKTKSKPLDEQMSIDSQKEATLTILPEGIMKSLTGPFNEHEEAKRRKSFDQIELKSVESQNERIETGSSLSKSQPIPQVPVDTILNPQGEIESAECSKNIDYIKINRFSPGNKEWDVEGDIVSRWSQASFSSVSRTVRYLFCCGFPYEASSEEKLAQYRDPGI